SHLGAGERLPDGFDVWFERCVDRAPERRFIEAGAAYEALARLPAPSPVGVVLSPRSPVPPGVVRAPLERPITPMTAVETPAPRSLALDGPSPRPSFELPPPPATRPPSTLNRGRVAGGGG